MLGTIQQADILIVHMSIHAAPASQMLQLGFGFVHIHDGIETRKATSCGQGDA